MSYMFHKVLIILLCYCVFGTEAQQIGVYPLGKFQLNKEVSYVALADDIGHVAAIDTRGLLKTWNLSNLTVIATKETGLRPIFLDYLRKDHQLIVIDKSGKIIFFDHSLASIKEVGLAKDLKLPVLDPEKHLLCFINDDDQIIVFNLRSNLPQHTIDLGGRLKNPTYLGFDQFGQQIFVVDNMGTALTIDPIRQQILSEYRIRSDEYDNSASVLHSVSANAAANYFVAGSQEVFIPKGGLAANTHPHRRNALIAIDGTTKSEIKRIRVNDRLDQVLIGPDLHNVTGFTEKKFDITIYDMSKGMEVARVTPPDIPVSIDLSNDGQFMAIGTDHGTTLVYELVRQSAPQIEISSPSLNRNLGASSVSESAVKVTGKISNARMQDLHLNGKPLSLGVANSFEGMVDLVPGKNRITISGQDFDSKQLTKEIYLTYEPTVKLSDSTNTTFETQRRVALVIGNANYESSAKLNNTINDAQLMTETLQSLGFEVTTIIDGTYEEMKNATIMFGSMIQDVDMSLYYYAGHGLEVEGVNYLVPVNAKIQSIIDIKQKTLPLTSVIRMGHYANQHGLNMVILDACRNNPFPTGQRGGAGLAKENAPSGTIIAYATAPGSVASDGSGDNGLYTSQLADQMLIPQRIEDIFIKTRVNVEQISNGAQQPWEEARLNGVFYLTFD